VQYKKNSYNITQCARYDNNVPSDQINAVTLKN